MQGSCLCGNIEFSVAGDVRGASGCHCGQCRKQSGHFWASAVADRDAVAITGDVTWYAASDIARRGFCARCGSFLFWDENGSDDLSFSLGALDGATGLKLGKHIFVADKGDYYEIADGLPQKEQ